MAYSYLCQLAWEPLVANTATRRAQQQYIDADVYQDVPLLGRKLPPVAITMTTEAYYTLGRALEFGRLQYQPTCGRIDDIFELGLAPLEREGSIPTAETRDQYLHDCREFIDRFDTSADESIEHAHLLSFDFGTFDLDAVLTHLRVWGFCGGKEYIYQLGIITNMLGCYDMQLFNSIPSKQPTHTIFFVRHCLWDGIVGRFLQLWEPLVQATDNMKLATAAGSEVQLPPVSDMPPKQDHFQNAGALVGEDPAWEVAGLGCSPQRPLNHLGSSGAFESSPKFDAQYDNTVLSPLATGPEGQASFAATPNHSRFTPSMSGHRSVVQAMMEKTW
ncbi:hypothetical protein BST61_g1297 [Cercospora zeina]